MRTSEEFRDEVYSRSKKRMASRRKKVKMAISGTAVVAVAMIIVLLGNFMGNTGNIITAQASDLMEGIYSEPVDGKAVDDTFVDGQMKFSVELFKETLKVAKGGNVLISPLSVMLALSMTANGAKGQTLSEMEAVLGDDLKIEELNQYLYSYVDGLPSSQDNKLSITNSIWVRDDILVEQDFLQTNANYYGAAAYKRAFDAGLVSEVNDWVKNNTDGLIDKIMEEVGQDDCAYLINAVLFDAKWQSEYSPSDRTFGNFNGYSQTREAVEYMTSIESIYLDDGNAIGFVKPYKGGNYSFVALLPNENIDIYDYIQDFDYEQFMATMDDATDESFAVTMPKFSYESNVEMKDILMAMGIETAFDGLSADFTGLGTSQRGNIYISKVTHKTFITVDGTGTKAGAITKVDMVDECGTVLPEKHIKLNRSFIYMIIDNETNLPIFMGTVMDIQ